MSGLKKLKETESVVQKLNEDLTKKKAELAQKSVEAEQKMKEIVVGAHILLSAFVFFLFAQFSPFYFAFAFRLLPKKQKRIKRTLRKPPWNLVCKKCK